eukprot:c28711_g1_i2 orf=518-1462(-)
MEAVNTGSVSKLENMIEENTRLREGVDAQGSGIASQTSPKIPEDYLSFIEELGQDSPRGVANSELQTENSISGHQPNTLEQKEETVSNGASHSSSVSETGIGEDVISSASKDSEDFDYPTCVEEEDPTWPDGPDDGWGFRYSDFFKDFKVKNSTGGQHDSDDDDVEEFDWEGEPDRWVAEEITSIEWEATVFHDPSPLVVLIFERYGKRASESFKVLKELEDVANQIWVSNKLPPRLVKIDASVEIDMASALRVTECPSLLFIKAGKLLHRLTGHRTSEDLLKIIAYFYYGARRPSCLNDTIQSPKNVLDEFGT